MIDTVSVAMASHQTSARARPHAYAGIQPWLAKRGTQVDIQHEIPVTQSQVLDGPRDVGAGCVDEDINAFECSEQGVCGGQSLPKPN